MPADQGPAGRDAERFAMAIEQEAPPGSVDDAVLARDLEIAVLLSARGDAYSPSPAEKARARMQLMARLARIDAGADTAPVAPFTAHDTTAHDTTTDDETTAIPVVPVETLVEDRPAAGPDDGAIAATTTSRRRGRRASRHAMPSRPAGRPREGSGVRGLGKRALLIGAATVMTVVAVAGGSVFASRSALPGDGLYGVKRVAESAGLAMTFDDAAKGRRQLDLATKRIDEVEQLATRDKGVAPPELYQATIKDFAASTGAGSRSLLTSDDVGGPAAVGDLRAWAGEQASRLSVLRSTLPTAAVSGADSSISLLDRILGRTEALGDRSSCTQVTSGAVDDLGPLPAQGSCTPKPSGSTGGSPVSSTSHKSSTTTSPATTDRSTTGPSSEPSTTPGTSGGAGAPDTSDKSDPTSPATDGSGPLPDGSTAPQDTSSSAAPTTTSAPSGGGGDINIPVPLPLVPPIQLPPLLPGQPGITIG